MFQLESAATDELLRSFQGKLVLPFYGFAGFLCDLLIDPDFTGQNGALGLLPAVAKSSLDQRLIQSSHAREYA